ncbi:MAG: hypothetical protein GY937_25620 [bacterium]|nr:hypothetical protein [bacterium]
MRMRKNALGETIRVAAIGFVVSGFLGSASAASWADPGATGSKTSPQGKSAGISGETLPGPKTKGAAEATKAGAPKLPVPKEAGSPVPVKPVDPRREAVSLRPGIPGERVPIDGRLPVLRRSGDRGRPELPPPGSAGVRRALATLLRLDGRTGSLDVTEPGDPVVPAEWHFADPAVDLAVLHVGLRHPASCPAAGTPADVGLRQLEGQGGTLLVDGFVSARGRRGFDLNDFRFRGYPEYQVSVCGLGRGVFTGERTNVVRVARTYLATIHGMIVGAEYRAPDRDFVSEGVALVTVRIYSPEGATVPGTQLQIMDFNDGVSGPCLPGGAAFEVPELPESGYVQGKLGFRCAGWNRAGSDLCVQLTINSDGRVLRSGGARGPASYRACVGGGSRDPLALTSGPPHLTAQDAPRPRSGPVVLGSWEASQRRSPKQ